MIRSVLVITVELTSLLVFAGMVAIWALIAPAVF